MVDISNSSIGQDHLIVLHIIAGKTVCPAEIRKSATDCVTTNTDTTHTTSDDCEVVGSQFLVNISPSVASTCSYYRIIVAWNDLVHFPHIDRDTILDTRCCCECSVAASLDCKWTSCGFCSLHDNGDILSRLWCYETCWCCGTLLDRPEAGLLEGVVAGVVREDGVAGEKACEVYTLLS